MLIYFLTKEPKKKKLGSSKGSNEHEKGGNSPNFVCHSNSRQRTYYQDSTIIITPKNFSSINMNGFSRCTHTKIDGPRKTLGTSVRSLISTFK